MHRFTDTLKAQAIAIFLAVLTLSQLITLVLFEQNRSKTIILTEATDLADRIIGIVDLARSFPIADRQKILAAAETQFLTMHPDIISPEEVACQDNDFALRMSERLNSAFHQYSGLDPTVCVRNLNPSSILNFRERSSGFDALVFVNFPEGSQTVFHTVLPEGNSIFEDSIIVYMVLVGVFALLLGWFMIQKAILPLEKLAKAADEFGNNIDKPPLTEDGPREVVLAAQAFNRMQQRITQLIYSQTEMLAAISHDLRSAVTRMQLRTDLLEDSDEKEGMQRTVNDMRLMVQSVLDFARGQNPKESLRRVNLSALVESLCEDLIEEGFDLTYHCEQLDIHLRCRPTDIRRGIQNIIDNAINYGEKAQLRLEQQEDIIVITVEDEGQGIPENQFEAVLQPFYRMDPSRGSRTAGVGLGLSITVNILRSLGGDIQLTNNPGRGLKVVMQIPLSAK